MARIVRLPLEKSLTTVSMAVGSVPFAVDFDSTTVLILVPEGVKDREDYIFCMTNDSLEGNPLDWKFVGKTVHVMNPMFSHYLNMNDYGDNEYRKALKDLQESLRNHMHGVFDGTCIFYKIDRSSGLDFERRLLE